MNDDIMLIIERLRHNVSVLNDNAKALRSGAAHDIGLLHERLDSLSKRLDAAVHHIDQLRDEVLNLKTGASLVVSMMDEAAAKAVEKIKGE